MSAIPAYFKGGIAPGSHVNVTYIGDLQTDPFEAVRIIAVTGEDPDTIDNKHISFTASGTIIGSTANTITLQTDDGAVDTFRIENAENLTEEAWNTEIMSALLSILPGQNLPIFILLSMYRIRKIKP